MTTTPRRRKAVPEWERYRRYTEAKNQLPPTLTPKEYEAAIRQLADRYKI